MNYNRNEKISYLQNYLASKYEDHLITKQDTQLVIEGYPRSSNTCLVDYIRYLYEKENINQLKISHHTHCFQNIELALLYNIPVSILIRTPFEAILSSFIYSGTNTSLENRFEHYINFYAEVNKVIDDVLLIEFSNVINNIEYVLSKMRTKFNIPIPHASANNEELEMVRKSEKIRGHKIHGENYNMRNAFPNEQREIIKNEYRQIIASHVLMPEANQLFLSLTSK